jgi:anti-anti-sigma factor
MSFQIEGAHMTIHEESLGSMSVVRLTGSLNHRTHPCVRARLHHAVHHEMHRVILNVARLRHMDVVGLAALLDISTQCRLHGVDLRIVGLMHTRIDPMIAVRLCTLCSGFDSELAAVVGFPAPWDLGVAPSS